MKSSLKYDMNSMIMFAFVGIIIKLFFGNTISADGTSGPASSAVWGYGIVALSVLSILFITFALTTRMTAIGKYNTIEFVMELIKGSFVPMLMFVILLWLISINITYYKQINEGNVADEYGQFSTISSILVVIQLIVLFKYLKDTFMIQEGGPSDTNAMATALKSQMASVTYILTILNLMSIGVMNIIVEFFSTDG